VGLARLNRAGGGYQRLPDDLSAKDPFEDGLPTKATEPVRPDLFKIESGEEFGDGCGHGGLWLAGRPSPERNRRCRQASRAY
jgi:hypothetical protein